MNRFNYSTKRFKNNIYENRLIKGELDYIKPVLEKHNYDKTSIIEIDDKKSQVVNLINVVNQEIADKETAISNLTIENEELIDEVKIANVSKLKNDIIELKKQYEELDKFYNELDEIHNKLKKEQSFIRIRDNLIKSYDKYIDEANKKKNELKQMEELMKEIINENESIKKQLESESLTSENYESLEERYNANNESLNIKIAEIQKMMKVYSKIKIELETLNENMNKYKDDNSISNYIERYKNDIINVKTDISKIDEINKNMLVKYVYLTKETKIPSVEELKKDIKISKFSSTDIDFFKDDKKTHSLITTFNKIIEGDYMRTTNENIKILSEEWQKNGAPNKYLYVIKFLEANTYIDKTDTIIGNVNIKNSVLYEKFISGKLKNKNVPKEPNSILTILIKIIFKYLHIKKSKIELELKKAQKLTIEEKPQLEGSGRKRKLKKNKLTDKDIKKIVEQIQKQRRKGGDLFKDIETTIDRVYDVAIHGERKDAPPDVREFIKRHRTDIIQSAAVYREPVQRSVQILGNIISLGKLEQAKQSMNYDDIFHVFMVITTTKGEKYLVEKNQVVRMVELSQDEINRLDSIQHVNVSGLSGLPFEYLINNARDEIGDDIFWSYNAENNNCQIFLMNLLRYSGALTEEVKTFLYQDAPQILSKIPAISKALINTATQVAALWDVVVKGRGFY